MKHYPHESSRTPRSNAPQPHESVDYISVLLEKMRMLENRIEVLEAERRAEASNATFAEEESFEYTSTSSAYHDNGDAASQPRHHPHSGAAITIAINGSQSVPCTPRKSNMTVPMTERRTGYQRAPVSHLVRSPSERPITTPSEIEATLLLVEKGPFYVVTRGREPGIYTDWFKADAVVCDLKGRKFGKKDTKEEALNAYRNAYESGLCKRIKA